MVSHSHELLRQIPVMIYFKYWLAAPARLSARNATTTTAVTSAGRTLHVSLKLVDPPAGALSLVRPLPRPQILNVADALVVMRQPQILNGSTPQSHTLLLHPWPRHHRLLRLPSWPHALWHFQLYPQSQLTELSSAVRLSSQTAVHELTTCSAVC